MRKADTVIYLRCLVSAFVMGIELEKYLEKIKARSHDESGLCRRTMIFYDK